MIWRTPVISPCGKTPQDLSRQLEKTYKEIAPYAVDSKGKCINPRPYVVLKESDPVNVYESIQSYRDSTDIYKLLEKVQNGEVLIQNAPTPYSGDFRNMPKSKVEIAQALKNLDAVKPILEKMLSNQETNITDNSITNDKKEVSSNE